MAELDDAVLVPRPELFEHALVFPTPSSLSSERPSVGKVAHVALAVIDAESDDVLTYDQWMEVAAEHLQWSRVEATLVWSTLESVLPSAVGRSRGEGEDEGSQHINADALAAFVCLQSYRPRPRKQPSTRKRSIDIAWPSPEEFASSTGIAGASRSPGNGASGGAASPRASASGDGTGDSPATADRADAIHDWIDERTSRVLWLRRLVAALMDALRPRLATEAAAAAEEEDGVVVSGVSPTAQSLVNILLTLSAPYTPTAVPVVDIAAESCARAAVQRLRRALEGDDEEEDVEAADTTPRGLAAAVESAVRLPLHVVGLARTTVIHAPAPAPEQTGFPSSASEGEASDAADTSGLHDLRVEAVVESQLYVLRAFRHVLIRGCSNTLVVVGAAAGVVTVDMCEGVTVVTACRHIRVVNSIDATLHVFTRTPTTVVGDCRNVRLAPHNVAYVGLIDDIRRARLIPEHADGAETAGHWDAYTQLPVISGAASGAVGAATGSPVGAAAGTDSPGSAAARRGGVRLMAPAEFSRVVVPAPAGGATPDEVPILPLPEPFVGALRSRRAAFRAIRERANARLDGGARVQLEQAIQAHFRDWLISSGHIREVVDLVRMAQRPSARAALHSPGGRTHLMVAAMQTPER